MQPMIFSLATAQEYAEQGRAEEWILTYLKHPDWANNGLAAHIEYQRPLWVGPIEVELTQLVRCAGPEPNIRWPENQADWDKRVIEIVDNLADSSALPPLIVRPDHGRFGVPDGNHRLAAMLHKGWKTGWVFLWCDREERFRNSWRRDTPPGPSDGPPTVKPSATGSHRRF